MMSSSEVDRKMAELTGIVQEVADGGTPVVGYISALPVNGKMSKNWSIFWGEDEVEELFGMPDYKVAQVLASLGSEVRLAILRELIKQPMTAAEVVAALNMQTTGQAYHHLKELQRAGYVEQKEGGRYHLHMKVARVYVAALALAANAGALEKFGSLPSEGEG